MLAAAAALASLAITPAAAAQDYEKLAPWPAVRWRDDVPEVEIEGRWYELVALEDAKSTEIVAFCKKTWPDKWQKRFEEDLVEVMARMDRPLGARVAMDVIAVADEGRKNAKKEPLRGIAMTRENRQRLWEARNAASRPAVERLEVLSRADAQADLDQLARLLGAEYSYYERARELFEGELVAAKRALPDEIERSDLARRVQALLCLLGDGHTQLDELEPHLPAGFAPYLLGDSDGKLVAFAADRGALLDPSHPYLVALDGVPVERWLEAAARLVPRGSPGFVRWHAIRQLRFVAWLRAELGLPAEGELLLQLADEKGLKVERKTALAARKPVYGDWPRSATRELDGAIGYLRIPSMDDEPAGIAALHAAMAGFGGARALVIDVRGNGGGSRLPLRELFPYFMRQDDAPRVANVAAYRLHAGESADRPEGWLADRWLFPLSSREWLPAEREGLAAFARSFRPQWTPPEHDFSAWHYFVLRPELPPGTARFAGPIAVLQDGGCFSATDIFLGALAGWRDVTLIGTPSGGGSGRVAPHRLEKSALELRASTMASFRPDGSLYDGRGVEPDVVVWPEATDFVGRGDAQLEAALARLAPKR
jgi:hypothetical protein